MNGVRPTLLATLLVVLLVTAVLHLGPRSADRDPLPDDSVIEIAVGVWTPYGDPEKSSSRAWLDSEEMRIQVYEGASFPLLQTSVALLKLGGKAKRCSGFLLDGPSRTETLLVTAQHCFPEDVLPNNVCLKTAVHASPTNAQGDSGTTSLNVCCTRHPSKEREHDIALCSLPTDFLYVDEKPVGRLSMGTAVAPGDEVTVAGWLSEVEDG